jgi:phosphatidylserine/phosphatidylglycerophosphate/cardiolipin synthase-like enzyme
MRRVNLKLVNGAEHYDEIICRELPSSRVALWIGTANLKELRVEAPIGTRARARGQYISILETFEALADRNVELRVLHGRAPSRAFREELGRRRRLEKQLQLRECPRVHLKTIIIDGRLLYLGSANFTGAGLGARAPGSRNFELGVLTEDDHLLDRVQAHFDAIWSGRECKACRLRRLCPRPIDTLVRKSPANTSSTRAPPRAETRGIARSRARSHGTCSPGRDR